ncbi:ankyrin repeat domain-containing protein [Bacillus sp. NP157]|nr:ankyrin repeat domain-containing protein [Bacillus sp. NP157]
MDELGYYNPDVARSWPKHDDGHPLIAQFSAARLLANAVLMRDPVRITRLLALGAQDVDYRHAHDVARGVRSYIFMDVTTVGLAVLADGEAGEVDAWGGHEGEPCALPPFFQAVDFLGPHDAAGNTLLHIAKAPRIAEWLLRRGLPLDATNDEGETPLDVAPPAVRSVFEQWMLEGAVPHVDHRAVPDGTRRRL